MVTLTEIIPELEDLPAGKKKNSDTFTLVFATPAVVFRQHGDCWSYYVHRLSDPDDNE